MTRDIAWSDQIIHQIVWGRCILRRGGQFRHSIVSFLSLDSRPFAVPRNTDRTVCRKARRKDCRVDAVCLQLEQRFLSVAKMCTETYPFRFEHQKFATSNVGSHGRIVITNVNTHETFREGISYPVALSHYMKLHLNSHFPTVVCYEYKTLPLCFFFL